MRNINILCENKIFITPPLAQWAIIASQCCSPVGLPSLRYTLVLKTVKARKSDGLV